MNERAQGLYDVRPIFLTRVLRGGGFDSQARYLRSASRFRYDTNVRFFANGFRVLRELQ